MSSFAWFTERSRTEWSGFRGAATPLGPENLENQPGPSETAPQYRISFGIDSILGRGAPPPFWAAKLGIRARMLSRAWFSECSRAEPQEPSNPSSPGKQFYAHATGPHRLCASLPECQASLGPQSAAERSGVDSEPQRHRMSHNIWKTSLRFQKQLPNTEFDLELAQFWAVARLPNSRHRSWATSPECQAPAGLTDRSRAEPQESCGSRCEPRGK